MSTSGDATSAAAERDDATSRVHELRRSVEDTRENLAGSLSTLKARLSPSEMLASTKSTVRESVRRSVNEAAREVQQGGRRLTRTMQEQPGWAALATVTAGSAIWYFSRDPRSRRSPAVRRPVNDSVRALTDAAPSAKRNGKWSVGLASTTAAAVVTAALASRRDLFTDTASARDSASEWGREVAGRASRTTAAVRGQARDLASRASRAASDVASHVDAGVAVTVGSALGVLAALLLPKSDWERDAVRRARQNIGGALERSWREGAEQARRTLLPAVAAAFSRSPQGASSRGWGPEAR